MTEQVDTADLLYGVQAIAKFLGLRERQARHLCEKGSLPTWKEGKMICSRRSTIRKWMEERERGGTPTDPTGQGGAGADDERE